MEICGFCSMKALTWLSKNCPLVPLIEYQTLRDAGASSSDALCAAGAGVSTDDVAVDAAGAAVVVVAVVVVVCVVVWAGLCVWAGFEQETRQNIRVRSAISIFFIFSSLGLFMTSFR